MFFLRLFVRIGIRIRHNARTEWITTSKNHYAASSMVETTMHCQLIDLGTPSLGEEGIQHRYVQVTVDCESVQLNDVWSWRVRFHIVLVDSVTSSACKTYTFNVSLNRSTRVPETVAVWCGTWETKRCDMSGRAPMPVGIKNIVKEHQKSVKETRKR